MATASAPQVCWCGVGDRSGAAVGGGSCPLPSAVGPDRAEARLALDDLGVHVGDVQARDLAGAVEDQRRLLGVVGVDVDLQRRVVADDEDRVADLLQLGHVARRFEPLTGDGEVGAVAVGLARVLGMGDPRGRVVVELGRVGALQGGDDPGEDDDDAVAAGVDDARLAQGGQQLGAALDRRLAGDDRALQRGGDQQVLLLGIGRGAEAALVLGQVREVVGDRGRHVAHHREHRALGRLAHGRVGPLGGSREARRRAGRDRPARRGARPAPRRRRGSAGRG